MWLAFVSHKLARLALPFVLLLAAGTSFALEEPARLLMFSAQALFYGMALLDPFVPEGWVLKRLSTPVRSFVVLLAAAFCAAFVLFRPAEEVWKETRG
jgi:hypothetical protein